MNRSEQVLWLAALVTGMAIVPLARGESVVIHHDPSKEITFPANYTSSNWQWGDTFLVAYSVAEPMAGGPDRLNPETRRIHLARTTDGGQTWEHWDPEGFVGDCEPGDLRPVPEEGIDLSHPDLAIICDSDFDIRPRKVRGFWVSYDRGSTWSGPYPFAGLALPEGWPESMITSRTDYQVIDDGTIVFFMTVKSGINRWHNQDAAFTLVSTDRGKTFRFGGWIATDLPGHRERFACPSSARIGKDRWVVALRRATWQADPERNRLDLYGSDDGGRSWSFRSRITDTNPGNGNPPALLRLSDRTLACAYGRRHGGSSINIRYSRDDGATWSPDYAIRGDAGNPQDLGYPRLFQRTDGTLVVVYYWTSEGRPQRHLCATIFDRHDVGSGTIRSIDHVSSDRGYVLDRAVVGARPYIDRDYEIRALPGELAGLEMIRTANEDDRVDHAEHLRFTLDAPATVYLAYEGDDLPSWAKGWGPQPSGIVQVSGAGQFRVFSKEFPAGAVTLGGNSRDETGAMSNYFVMLKPREER